MQREHAGQVQQQHAAQQATSGDMDRQHPQQCKSDDVAGQIWDDRPVRREDRSKYCVIRTGGQQHLVDRGGRLSRFQKKFEGFLKK